MVYWQINLPLAVAKNCTARNSLYLLVNHEKEVSNPFNLRSESCDVTDTNSKRIVTAAGKAIFVCPNGGLNILSIE